MLKQKTSRKKQSDASLTSPKLRGEELLLLYEIGKVVNSTLDLNEVLQSIMKMTTNIFKAEAASIMLFDKHGELRIAAAQGLSDEIIKNTRISPGEGIAGWVAQTKEPILLDGKVKDVRFKSLVDRKDDVKSSLCVPLIPKERIIGVLMLRNPTSAPNFTTDHLRFLSAIADQVAIALEHARLYKAEQERSAEIGAIISSMADGVIVTNIDGEIALINPIVENIFGISQDSILGKHFNVLFEGLSLKEHYNKVLLEQKPVSSEITINKPSEFCFRLYSTPMSGSNKEMLGVVTLLQDITELKRIAKMKSDFVSLVTHELKTPLTSIQGFVEVLLARELPRDKIVSYLNIVKEETGRLVRLINNLLDLSKLEAGKFQLNRDSVDLISIIKDNLQAVEQLSQKHNFVLLKDLPADDIPLVYADKDIVTQIINNLLSNAIKYSPNGGTITINIDKQEEQVEVSITDEGIGIPTDKLSGLFEKFYRVKAKSSGDIKGTGLGLANVKYLVEQHGGTLRVKSREGIGSTFTFTLPIHPERYTVYVHKEGS